MITHLKDELARAHDRIVLLEQQGAEKEQCIQELTDSLMLRVSKSLIQKSSSVGRFQTGLRLVPA